MKMEEIKMNDEEKANNDKLEFYYNENIIVHIVLKREIYPGRKSFLNGLIVDKLNERLWNLDENKLGEVRLSISEIAPNGVHKFTRVGI